MKHCHLRFGVVHGIIVHPRERLRNDDAGANRTPYSKAGVDPPRCSAAQLSSQTSLSASTHFTTPLRRYCSSASCIWLRASR